MTKKLWQASLKQKKNSNLFAFENYISKKFSKNFNNDYQKILDWSIKYSSEFWSSFWDFAKIKGIKGDKDMNSLIKNEISFYSNQDSIEKYDIKIDTTYIRKDFLIL